MGLTYISTPLDITVDDTAVATVDITTGIDATYNEYQFHFANMHPASDNAHFQFQVNASNDTGGGFDTSVITSTTFSVFQNEAGSSTSLAYEAGFDQAQVAGYQTISSFGIGNNNDQSVSGILKLYDPSSTTYVKHFTAEGNGSYYGDYSVELFAAGYINQTLAIPEISFKFHSGNIDAGTIHMYGVG